ncbi:hypothetical protein SPHINGOR109_51298 [Sphingorhabdus sp. 109]|nr:hypothetical protein SPHINGOR109_51298 [Sphingorhabdus sp. 109]
MPHRDKPCDNPVAPFLFRATQRREDSIAPRQRHYPERAKLHEFTPHPIVLSGWCFIARLGMACLLREMSILEQFSANMNLKTASLTITNVEIS